MANVSITSIAAVSIIFLGLIVSILSLAVDYWAQYKIGGAGEKAHYGLINFCVCREVIGIDDCVCVKFVKLADRTDSDIPAYLRGSLAGVCLAFIANLVALFTMIMWILNIGSESVTKILKILTIALLGIAVFWNFIAVVVFGAMDKKEQDDASEQTGIPFYDYKLGWAFGMAILAAIFELAGLFVTGLAQKSE